MVSYITGSRAYDLWEGLKDCIDEPCKKCGFPLFTCSVVHSPDPGKGSHESIDMMIRRINEIAIQHKVFDLAECLEPEDDPVSRLAWCDRACIDKKLIEKSGYAALSIVVDIHGFSLLAFAEK